jgi:serine protease AprX
MPYPNRPPDEWTPEPSLSSSRAFDPATRDRTVIAIPLLEKIEEEKTLIKGIRKKYPKEAEEDNCLIMLPREQLVTSKAVQAAVQKLIDEALANPGEEVEAFRSKHRLGKRLPGQNALFAWLHARTIRRILNRQDLRHARDNKFTPLIERILPSRFKLIIDLNLEFMGGRDDARRWVERAIPAAIADEGVDDPGQRIEEEKSQDTGQYVFATLEADVIARLVEMDAESVTSEDLAKAGSGETAPKTVKVKVLERVLSRLPAGEQNKALKAIPTAKLRAINRIWPDFEVQMRITRSIATVGAKAAINSFGARGTDITWAVLDTGIQGDHPHFKLQGNIVDPASPLHRDFTSNEGRPLVDANGHGTHVAGIIAGEWIATKDKDGNPVDPLTAVSRFKDELGDEQQEVIPIEAISGMAPECRLVSLKVLDENGIGNASNLIAAIVHVQEINSYGRRMLIHGVNISICFDFDSRWGDCGQSPLCVEVDRLVKSGVVVVVAAGDAGFGQGETINDPGNADLAITVGATHRDMPREYGVCYFSSKGPTGDGRLKPDVVAPGENIISCASSLPPDATTIRLPSQLKRDVAQAQTCEYIVTSGTSMAAAHVSGLAAGFLSVRREFIGRPEQVKEILVSTCTDLKRDRSVQGHGLVNLMGALTGIGTIASSPRTPLTADRDAGLSPQRSPTSSQRKLGEVVMNEKTPKPIFISYSHKDKRFFQELKIMLAPAMRDGIVHVWDDERIDSGAKWKEEIQKALASAKVAVLLVSQHFLASDFIAKHELPPLLQAAEEHGVTIFWIYLSSCLYQDTEIATFEAAHDVARPLDRLAKPDRQAILQQICAKLIQTARSQ